MINEQTASICAIPDEIRGYSTAQAAKFLGLSESFLEKSRGRNPKTPGPVATKIGSRVVYLKENLDAYLDNPPTL